MSCVRRNRFK